MQLRIEEYNVMRRKEQGQRMEQTVRKLAQKVGRLEVHGFPFVSEVFFSQESDEWSMLKIMPHICRTAREIVIIICDIVYFGVM